jgi:hypothetical protein
MTGLRKTVSLTLTVDWHGKYYILNSMYVLLAGSYQV